MDVDGTLTDGKIYIGNDGEAFKAFDVKDGYGIHNLLPQRDILPVIITARRSTIVENRCKELDIRYLFQNVKFKADELKRFLNNYNIENNTSFNLSNVAYIGDDISDLECMEEIKFSNGIVGCPANACQEAKEISSYICKNNGGEGAVREFIEYIIRFKTL